MLHECFRHTRVYAVHRHVVAVISGPSEGEFREVACAEHHAANLVGIVHENLSAFAGLAILVCNIVDADVVVNVGEMLLYGVADRDFEQSDTEVLHQ